MIDCLIFVFFCFLIFTFFYSLMNFLKIYFLNQRISKYRELHKELDHLCDLDFDDIYEDDYDYFGCDD